MKGKSSLISLIVVHKEMVSSVDEQQWLLVLTVVKGFGTICCKILTEKLMKQRLDR